MFAPLIWGCIIISRYLIRDIIQKNPGITAREIIEMTGLTYGTAKMHLVKLERHGQVHIKTTGKTNRTKQYF